MIKHNTYFEGNVQSLSLEGLEKPATVGVMAPGEYTFGTDAKEAMTVVSGSLTVKLPGNEQWETFDAGTTFYVPENSSFDLKVNTSTAYLCVYG